MATGQAMGGYLVQTSMATEPLLYPMDGIDSFDPGVDAVFAGLNFTNLFDSLLPEFPPQ
jgi:hypothetical protein